MKRKKTEIELAIKQAEALDRRLEAKEEICGF